MSRFNPHIRVEADNLVTPEVRAWSLDKYKLVGSYCDIFTTGMRNKWNQLVYIDLFAGAGFAKIRETQEVYLNSALVAMSLPCKFSKYVLCESDPDNCQALRQRVERMFPDLDYEIIQGDSNSNINRIKQAIPPFRKGNTRLSFCFVDPFSLKLNFNTIMALGENLMDFLILQALHMDANRNFDRYLKAENTRIADYLGIENWRELFEEDGHYYRKDFVRFLADQYQSQMVNLGYQSSKQMHHIKSNDKNLPLYYLSFYSKHPTGEKFFNEVKKRMTTQLTFGF